MAFLSGEQRAKQKKEHLESRCSFFCLKIRRQRDLNPCAGSTPVRRISSPLHYHSAMSPKVNSAIIAILDVFDKTKVKNTPRTGVLFLYSSSGSRTLDAGVKNRSLNRLTNEPLT